MSFLPDVTGSPVSGIIAKLKHLRTTAIQLSGVAGAEAPQCKIHSADSITAELRTSSGVNVSAGSFGAAPGGVTCR